MLSPMDSTVNSSGVGAGSTSPGSAEYRKKRIKNVQKLELVRLMKANFLFIRGKHAVARCEKSRGDVWKMITARLNNLGPPVQSAEAWQRRWNDMRSATKSKMAKIQNYIREHGDECPYKLNLVERLIWDTFSVKPEEYIKDLNMKLWREKHQLGLGQPSPMMAIDSESGSSADVSLVHGFEPTGRSSNALESITSSAASSPWQDSMSFATGPMSNQTCSRVDANQPMEPINPSLPGCSVNQDSFYPQSTSGMSYGTYLGVSANTQTSTLGRNTNEAGQWHNSVSSSELRVDGAATQSKTSVPPDMVSANKVLRDLNKLFDLVLRQNEEILNLLRQSCSEN
ncbi:uncharacterized protein LOC131284924 [Anopheles ziemanni]|uniref:uncharacterized protein LOC131262380 n=1 Tax=Anopheles coustani TaxID=139045 RepID=UPI0026592429|nr:uncharacterized protein LOC131262380 [Anopheles coustani]XP_058169766.1 uncharacterized protein LOC131284924 [Anopheles ziemanni]